MTAENLSRAYHSNIYVDHNIETGSWSFMTVVENAEMERKKQLLEAII